MKKVKELNSQQAQKLLGLSFEKYKVVRKLASFPKSGGTIHRPTWPEKALLEWAANPVGADDKLKKHFEKKFAAKEKEPVKAEFPMPKVEKTLAVQLEKQRIAREATIINGRPQLYMSQFVLEFKVLVAETKALVNKIYAASFESNGSGFALKVGGILYEFNERVKKAEELLKIFGNPNEHRSLIAPDD